MTQAPAQPVTTAQHTALLRRHVVEVIRNAERNHPRSLQKAIGPSEVGHPCARRIAYKLYGFDEINDGDRWRTTVGTAVHAWLAETFEAADRAAGGGRYLVEHRVDPGGPEGTSDLFIRVLDLLSGTVTDWKIVGPTSLARYRTHGPSEVYRVQFHLYGKGMRRAGQDVRWVSMVALPSAGSLDDAVVWSEPFDESIADRALARLNDITLIAASLDVESDPGLLAAIPATPNRLCAWCPFYRYGSKDLARGCPGDSRPS